MIRILHAARVEAGNEKDLDMEILLNQVGGIFKAEEEATSNEDSLQAALSANVQRANYANRGMAAQDRKGPTSAGLGVHSRAQCARALPGVLMAQVSTLRVEIFQECTLVLRVQQESAHFF